METGPQLKVSSDRLVKPGIEPATSGLQGKRFIHYTTAAPFLSECKMERWNSQREQGQPMEQTRGLFCMCDSGVARCKSQHKCHLLGMSLMFYARAGELGSCHSNLCHT